MLFDRHGLNGRADIAPEAALEFAKIAEFAKIDLPYYKD